MHPNRRTKVMHLCFPLSKYILHQIWAVEVAMGKFEAVKDEGEFMIWYNSLVLYAVQVGVCACAYESCQVLVFTQFQMNCWNVNIQLLLPDPDRGAWYLFAALPISLLLTWMTLTLTLTLTVFVYICLLACLVCQGTCMLVCVSDSRQIPYLQLNELTECSYYSSSKECR